MINHLDLFSGIGGFSLAAEMVWGKNINHTFVEYDPYCKAVLKKHWPEAEVHGDIRRFIADAEYRIGYSKETVRTGRIASLDSHLIIKDSKRQSAWDTKCGGDEERTSIDVRGSDTFPTDSGGEKSQRISDRRKDRKEMAEARECHLLTGGFPCQPFSQAGRRKGTDDDRYLWPEMLSCVQLFQPTWVVAENVAGLVTWNDGLVFQTVCTDLESAGYEVQTYIIPACAVEAPHRRDRIWIIAHARHAESSGRYKAPKGQQHGGRRSAQRVSSSQDSDDADTRIKGLEGRKSAGARHGGQSDRAWSDEGPNWRKDWPEVAAALCRVDDGISRRLDRTPRLKALGNSICVPLVAEIFRSIATVYPHIDSDIAIPHNGPITENY